MSPPIDIDGSEIQEATIDGQDVSEITIDGQQAAELNVIPDSVVHQYTAENFATPWLDNIGSADMTVDNLTSSTFGNGEDSVAGDGTDDHGLSSGPETLGESFEFGLAFTVSSPGLNDLDTFFGTTLNSQEFNVATSDRFGGTPGNISFRLDHGTNSSQVATGNTIVDDGSTHAVVINKPSDSVADWQIYIDDMTVNTISNRDGGFDHTQASFTTDLGFFADNQNGSMRRFAEASIGVIEFNSSTYSQTEREAFVQRRPEV